MKHQRGFTLIELLIVIAIIGILAAIAIPNLLNAVQRAKQKRTMSDMRALATAIEAYHVDNGMFPTAACPGGVLVTVGTALATNSMTFISPTYIAQAPKIDGWGRPLYYNVNAGGSMYNIASGGRDTSVSTPSICGTTTDFNDDIMYANGTFVQWPEGVQQ